MTVIPIRSHRTKPETPVRVDVERCVRHRGEFSLINYFCIGKAARSNSPITFRVYLCPMSYIDKWLPTNQQELIHDNMIKWAEGVLTKADMMFWNCLDSDADVVIPDVLRYTFQQRHSNERLEDFHQAHVRLLSQNQTARSLGTIADLIKAYR